MPSKDSISVIIPVYNAEKYLPAAVESVLEQTIQPMEIILVDDGSTDRSVEVAEKFLPEITLIRQENKGSSGAKNAGIRHAKSNILGFLDSDDIWPTDHIEKLLALFHERKELHMAFGYVQQFISEDVENSSQEIPEDQEIMRGYVAGASLTKKEVFDNVGLFNEDLNLAEYIDWFARAKEAGYLYDIVDHIVLKRRIHTHNIGIQKRNHIHDYTKVLMDSIKRKRKDKKQGK